MSGHPPNPVAACVMLAPPNWATDPELDQALRRKDVEVIRVTSPWVAMAEVCRRARDRRTLGIILLLVEPAALTEPATLARCVERYAPRTACWMFDRSQGPRLRSVQPKDLESWAAATITLRLAGQPQHEHSPAPTSPPANPGTSASRGLAERVAAISAQSQHSPGASPSGPENRRPVDHQPGKTSENYLRARDLAQNGRIGQVLTKAELSMLLASDGLTTHNQPG